jgi:hypothetical protein
MPKNLTKMQEIALVINITVMDKPNYETNNKKWWIVSFGGLGSLHIALFGVLVCEKFRVSLSYYVARA